MTNLNTLLAADETMEAQAELHWIHIAKGFLWLLGLSIGGITLDSILINGLERYGTLTNPMGLSMIEWLGITGGVLIFSLYYFGYISTFIWVTNRRIIYKTGLIFIKIKETDLQEIKEQRVNQGWFGSLLDYGYIYMNCRFVENLQLPEVKDPLSCMKAVYKAREHLVREVVVQ